MAGKSNQNTPSRSSTRPQKKTAIFQVGDTKTPKKNVLNVKEIKGHNVYDTHYVDYEVILGNGQTKEHVTEFEFEKNSSILLKYKERTTKQKDDPNGVYVVESILAHRLVNGKPLFLVGWEGYSNPLWNSEMWEEDLSNCKNLLRTYKNENDLSTSTPARTSSRVGKQAPKPNSKPSQKPKRTLTPEDEDFEPEEESTPPVKKAKSPIKKDPQSSSSKNVIERVEEVQESDDDDDEEEDDDKDKPSTSTSAPAKPAETKSRWGFGSWSWF